MPDFNASEFIKEKIKSFNDYTGAKKWFEQNYDLIKRAFKDKKINDFIFEPFKDVLQASEGGDDGKIKSVITQVAVANMVLGGLPGKLGVGVVVSMGLEAWMAYEIAKQVGIKLEKPSDVFKYFSLLAGVLATITVLFKELLLFVFSLFSFVAPVVSPMVFAELAVTDLVGVMFWFGFKEAKEKGSFQLPKRVFLSIGNNTKDLFKYQYELLKNCLTIENIKLVGRRLKAWFKGDISINEPGIRGEIFPFIAMYYLIERKFESFDGPLGDIFIEAIRRGYSNKLGDATLEEMATYFEGEKGESLKGHISLITGEMREHLGVIAENTDGDEITMVLNDDRTVAGYDAVMFNSITGDEILVSFKSTSNPSLIESALKKYPKYPIVTTTEIEEYYGDHPMVMFDGISDSDLKEVTKENFEQLSNTLEKASVSEIAAAGVASKAIASLYPFVIAYLRRRISQEQLSEVFEKVLGQSGVEIASRISWGLIFGTVFAWYLLARGVLKITQGAESLANKRTITVQI